MPENEDNYFSAKFRYFIHHCVWCYTWFLFTFLYSDKNDHWTNLL